MKKILLLSIFISLSLTSYTQEKNEEIDLSFHRFGMNVASLGVGIGITISPFPLSFYIANDLQQIISFGIDFGYNSSFSVGIHFGYGKMYQSKSSNSNLYLGYLMEFSGGYTPAGFLGGAYLGFSPNFILEINQFVFKLGAYVDTSLVITGTVGLGFLIN